MTRSILLRRLLLLLSLWVGTPLPLAAQGTAFPELLPRRLADVGLLLDRTSGLRLQPIAGGLGGAAIRIRGLSGRYTQLLLDGLPLLGASASPLSALQLPPIGLTGVEVQAGPASARYGLHAAGGLVDLVSRRPDGQREAWYHETSREGTDVLVYWSGAARPLSYTVTGGLHAQDMLDPDDDVWADVPAFRRVTVRPRAFWQGARGTLVATAGGTWEKREGGTPAGRRLKNNVQYREQLETRRADAGLNGRYRLGESLHLGVRAAAVRDRRERRLNTTITADARSIALLEATLLGRGGAHRWLAGGSVERDSYSGYEVQLFDFRYTSPALFLEDAFRPRVDIEVTGNARVDFHNEYGTLPSGAFSVEYRPRYGRVRLSGGTGANAPDPFTDVTEALGLRTLRPLGRLEPERTRGAALEVSRVLGAIEVNGSLFAATVSDPVRTRAPASNQLEIGNAAGPLRSHGGELSVRARVGGVHALAAGTLLSATEAHPDSAGHRRDVPLTPRRTALVQAGWEPRGLGRLVAEAYYVGEQALADNPFRARSRPYWLLSALAEVELGRAALFLAAENLRDVRQTRTDPLLRSTRSRAGFWPTDAWAPLDGRVLSGGVKVLLGAR